MFHEWIALVIFGVLALAGIGLTFIGVGGTFLILLGAVLYNLISWNLTISVNLLLWLAGLAILGEILEWLITVVGMRAAKVSKHAITGTIVGGVIGAFALTVIPIIGTIIGLILGAIIGAFIAEFYHTGHAQKAWKAAKAALLGRALVSLSKFIIAVIQIWLVLQQLQL